MLSEFEKAQQRWGGANQLIDKWLESRQDLLVAYCELANLPPFAREDSALPSATEIKRFCQILVDYISAGHFEVFEKVRTNGDNPDAVAQLLPQIYHSTDIAIAFNDKYTKLNDTEMLEGFDDALSRLVHYLEQRFELEDQLISYLYQKS